MTKKRTIFLLFGVLLIGIGFETYPIWKLTQKSHIQMIIGKRCMDEITLSNSSAWIQYTEELLRYRNARDSVRYYPDQLPPLLQKKLKEMKILSVQVFPRMVYFIWLGGMDHTRLEVTKESEGSYRFNCVFNNESSRNFIIKK